MTKIHKRNILSIIIFVFGGMSLQISTCFIVQHTSQSLSKLPRNEKSRLGNLFRQADQSSPNNNNDREEMYSSFTSNILEEDAENQQNRTLPRQAMSSYLNSTLTKNNGENAANASVAELSKITSNNGLPTTETEPMKAYEEVISSKTADGDRLERVPTKIKEDDNECGRNETIQNQNSLENDNVASDITSTSSTSNTTSMVNSSAVVINELQSSLVKNTNNTASSSSSEVLVNGETATKQNSTASTEQVRSEPIGIGGSGGHAYDVNSLKRNLLQETMTAYKQELWKLFDSSTATEEEIFDKLAALVQVSPVSTTTDSNYLDGADWHLTYQSKQTPVDTLFDSNRLTTDSSFQKNPLSRPRGAGSRPPLFRTTKRQFFLEELEDDEDAYVRDQRGLRIGNLMLWQRQYVYEVVALSRTYLAMELSVKKLSVLGQRIWKKEYEFGHRSNPIDLNIVYLDDDLCISSENNNNSFQVYTKNIAFVNQKQRIQGLCKDFKQSIKNRYKMLTKMKKKKTSGDADKSSSPQGHSRIVSEILSDASKLTVVRLGMVDPKDDEVWDSQADPFVHLSADARQDRLKQMNVKQIEEAGRRQQMVSKVAGVITNILPRKRATFKGPKKDLDDTTTSITSWSTKRK